MPIYEYKCARCEHVQEEMHKADNPPSSGVSCEECGAEMYKVPSAANLGNPPHQMAVTLENGQNIKGHFGKAARKR